MIKTRFATVFTQDISQEMPEEAGGLHILQAVLQLQYPVQTGGPGGV